MTEAVKLKKKNVCDRLSCRSGECSTFCMSCMCTCLRLHYRTHMMTSCSLQEYLGIAVQSRPCAWGPVPETGTDSLPATSREQGGRGEIDRTDADSKT